MKLAQNSLFILITKICILGILLINDAIISRTLGPAGKGLLATVIIIPLWFEKVGTLSLASASIYNIAKKKHNFQEVASNLLSMALLIGLLFVLSFAIWNKVFIQHLMKVEGFSFILWVVVGICPLLLISNYLSSIFISQGRIKDFNLIQIGKPITVLILILFGALKYGVYGAILALCAGIACNTIIALSMFSRIGSIRLSVNIPLLKDLFLYSVRLHGAMILSIFLKRFQLIVLVYYLDKRTVGLFSVALIISELLLLIPAAITPLLLSNISASPDDDREITSQVSRTIFCAMLVLAILMAVSSIKLIPLIWGSEFKDSILPLLVLLPGMVAFGNANILTTHLLGIGRPGLGTILTAVATLVNVLLCFLLIPGWGLLGASLANSMAMFVLYGLAIVSFIKLTHVPIKECFVISREDLRAYKNILSSIRK